MYVFLFLHYSSCSACITASLPLPHFLSLMLLFLPFYCDELFLFPLSPFSSMREIQAVLCVKELGLSNNRSFYWTFCELSGWVCMNNTCGDPLTSSSLLKESISIPPYPILQAPAPLSAHCNRLWGMRSPYHRPVQEHWDCGRELYITFLLVKWMLMWSEGSSFLGQNKWWWVFCCSLVQRSIMWPTL